MASTIAAITTGIGGIVTTADATGNLSLLSGTSTVVAVTSAGAAVTGTISVSGATTLTGGLNTPLAVTSGGTGVATSTGSGANVLGTSPTLTTPTISTITSAAATALTLQSASTTAVTIDTSQNVGIGTASPSEKLTLIGNQLIAPNTSSTSADTYVQVRLSGTGDGSPNSVRLGVDGAALSGVAYINTLTAGVANITPLAFRISGTERMRIDSSGNVGIGTSSPGSFGKLAVAGAIAPIGAVGTSSIDVTGAATTVASGGTVNFPNASGMLVVNQHNTGGVTIYLCGGGGTAVVSNIISQVGTFAYNSGIAGYTWTSSSTTDYGFFFVRTRTTA